MKRKTHLRTFFTACLFSVLIPLSPSTQSYQIESAKFEVVGTSTIHDWTMESNSAIAATSLTQKDNQIINVERLKLKVKSESLKSGKGKMDDIAYDALKSEEHPWIVFEMTEIESIKQNEIIAIGNLSIAGKTKKIKLKGQAQNRAGITISGSKDIKMTDYDIEPPTAMFGTIKTGDDLTINYSITLKLTKS